jgi:ribosomal protein S16
MLLIRLKRRSFGHQLSYSIIISSNKPSPSSEKFLEKIGYYKPYVDRWSNKYIFIDVDRLKFWIERGAKVNTSVFVLLRPVLAFNTMKTLIYKKEN